MMVDEALEPYNYTGDYDGFSMIFQWVFDISLVAQRGSRHLRLYHQTFGLVDHPFAVSLAMEFSKRLVTAGKFAGQIDYEPTLWPLPEGARVNIVAQVTMRDDTSGGGHWCQAVITGQRFRLKADIPELLGCPKVTILNAAKSYFCWPVLTVDSKAEVLVHPPKSQEDMMTLIETCAGLGGLGAGAEFAGWKIAAQNDCNPKFTAHQEKVSNAAIITGDIGQMDTVAALHKANSRSSAIAFGFACQPYSKLGDRREGQDPRSESLPSSLYAAFLLQKDLVICECVPGAATSKYVLTCLDYYMEQTGSDRTEILLELSHVWPSRRRRWWTVILKQYLGKVSLMPFPRLSAEPTVASLSPQFLPMTEQELESLLLTNEERKGFAGYGKGIGTHLVDKNQPLATALHSWGNQLIHCSCGCRGPFSHERLSKQGLFGAIVHVAGMSPDKNLRHLSAREVALLTGFPKAKGWDDDPRLLLAGIGQLASPLQAAWIFAQVRNHPIDSKVIDGPLISPKEIIACAMTELFDLRDQWLPNVSSVTTQLFQEQFDEWALPKSEAKPSDPTTFDELTPSQEEAMISRAAAVEKQVASSNMQVAEDVKSANVEPDEACPGPVATNGVMPIDLESTDVAQVPEPETSQATPDAAQAQPKSMNQYTVPEPIKTCRDDQKSHVHTVQHAEPSIRTSPEQEVIASSVWEPSTGAINAFATCKSPSGPEPIELPPVAAPESQRYKVRPPKQVCQTPHELVESGVMIYDVDTHQIFMHRCTPTATFSEWSHASANLGVQFEHCVDMFGSPISDDQNLLQLKWIIGSQQQVDLHACDLHERARILSRLPRIESCLLQGPAVATDEMFFYLQAVSSIGIAKARPPFIVDGLSDLHEDAQNWQDEASDFKEVSPSLVRYAAQWYQQDPRQEATVTAIWINHHWIPIWLVPSSSDVVVHTTHEGLQVWGMLFPWWNTPVHVHDDFPSRFPQDCGFRALAWLVAQCTHTQGTSLSYAEAIGWRNLFWQNLVVRPGKSQIFVLGGQSELETALQAILKEHGVFSERLADRTTLILRSFTHQNLASAFQSPRPWQMLKHMASSHRPPIRLVQEDELQATIRARTKDKKSVQAKTKKMPSQVTQVHVHPDDINIPQGIFCLQTGEPLVQISQQHLGQTSKGVIAFTESEVQPYLQHAPAATSGLGFLVLAPFSETIAQRGQVLRFPVQSKLTSEPMLISAVLIQRGSVPVIRNVPSKPQAVEQVATQTIKCLLYRDQVPDAWETVIAKPVKYIIDRVEALQVCKQPHCACAKWHPGDQQADTPILDVWQRDFLSIHFQKVRPSDAQIYVVAMRVTTAVYQTLFMLSGLQGLYIEPRTDDGRSQDPKYQTVWVPKQSFSDIKAIQATQGAPVSLIRVSHRYGLKVSTDSAEGVHASINPQEPFIAGDSRIAYRVGPFPWGTTRKAIQQLFQQWQWQARVIHTIAKAKDSSGLMWLVHSTGPPTSLVYQLEHGDVVIHQENVSSKEPWKPPQAQTSIKEFKDRAPEVDFDPWAEAARKLPRSDNMSATQLASIEANVEQKVMQRLQDHQEGNDVAMGNSLEPRVSYLEQQLASLQTKSGLIENKVDHLHQQVDQQSKKFEAALDNKLSEQMQRIEALMSKRSRAHE